MRKNLFIVCLFLTSCIGDRTKISLTKDVSLEKTVSLAKETDLFVEGDYPEQDWYKQFKDDCLSCLIETAIAQNPGLESMKKRIDVANQSALMTRSQLFPQVSGLFQYLWLYFVDTSFIQNLLPGLSHNRFLYNLMFNFNYEFDFWGKNLKKYKAALGSMHTTRMQYEQSKLMLTTSVAKSYFNLMAMRSKKDVLEQMVAQNEKALELVQLRRQNRLSSDIVVQTSDQTVRGLQESILAVDREILLEESMINILLGRNPEDHVATKKPYEIAEYKLELPEKITTTLLSRRPDLLAQLWVAKKNAIEIGVAVTEFLPDVTIMEGPALLSNKGAELFNGDSFANLLFPEITQPLFTGGRLLANWRKSKATYEASVLEFNEMFLKAAKDVRDSIIKFAETTEREDIQKGKLELAKRNYELEFLKFSHGVSSMLTVIDLDEIYLENKTTMIERERQKKIAYIIFIEALGGGFKSSTTEEELGLEK